MDFRSRQSPSQQGIRNTRWPARLETHPDREAPEITPPRSSFSTSRTTPPAHGHCALGCAILFLDQHPRTLIFSCLRDKPVVEMAHILFPIFDQVIFAPINSTPRHTDARSACRCCFYGHPGLRGSPPLTRPSSSLSSMPTGSSREPHRCLRLRLPCWAMSEPASLARTRTQDPAPDQVRGTQ